EILVEVAMQYNQSYGTNILTFANTINTKEGGTHLTGFKGALTRVMNSYLENEQFKKFKGMILSGEDVREGLTAILSIMLPDPQFESQTKIKLGNPEIRQIVSRIVSNELEKHLEENPETAKSIIYKALEAKKARDAAQSAKQLIRRKSALDSIRLPGKLADCSSSESEKCELFIVEGSSAGGSAKQGRDREFQAILPLRGKILNVEKSRIHKILNNKEIQAMIKTIDAGIEGIDDEPFDLAKLRYHKIIIMCDADIDGSHIETLLLTFFFRYMRPLIENGHLYVALPPLYKINYKKFKKYAFNDKERDNIVKDLMEKYKIKIENKGSIKIQRYKGLGEMNPPELYETTMNKDNRSLLRVKIEDLIETDQIFSQLMGDEVQPRKKFIVDKYKDVKVLDI
ncbi:MAG: DNA topoisomerase IV subunit B, partial [Candidatus Lokiarchaeota archaeon]|nr:DNA topoisomerase IV subunit B [Candidatus Lokiarchaeota archaeon]